MGAKNYKQKTTEGTRSADYYLLSGNVRQELKPKLWLFVLYLFDPNFLKMAPGTHNVATNRTHA